MRIIIVILLIITYTGFGQKIEGIVISESTKAPIPYASIYFSDLHLGASTDAFGVFSIETSVKLPTKIEVKAFGYKNKQTTINFKNDTIVLTQLHYQLNEVIISIPSGKLQQKHITNVTSKKIKELSYIPSNNIIQKLGNIPGVSVSSNGAGISKPTIRGLTGSRIVTVLNGLRLENQQWGLDHGSGVTALGIKAVEVIKGPASLLYGSDALGGILYFTDINYSSKTQGFYNSSFESNNLGINNQIGVQLSKNNLRANIMASHSTQADYMIPDGNIVKNSRFSDYNFKTAIGYQHKNYNLNFRYNYLNARVGIPGHSHSDSVSLSDYLTQQQLRSPSIPAQLIENHYLLLDNKFYFSNSTLSVQLGQVINNLKEHDEKITFAAINMLLNTSSYNVKWDIPFKNSSLVIGGQGMYQQNKNLVASEQIIPSSVSLDNGVFALYNKKVKKWDLQAGVRFDNRSLELKESFKENKKGTLKNFNNLNYSVGAAKVKNKQTFRINLSSGYRAPNSSELYSNGIHHGAIRYEIGANNLRSEQANQLDMSWEMKNEHLALVINPYVNHINNYIFISPTDSTIDGKKVYKYEQTQSALLFGGEAGIHYHPHFAHRFHFETSFSYTEGRLSSSKYLPLIPQPKTNTLLKFEANTKGKLRLENISLQHEYYLPQNKLGLNESNSVDYHLINLGSHIKLNFKWETQVDLGIKNLFNTNYINHLSQLKELQIMNPGRSFYIGLKIKIK